jgi:acyl-CoA synthetase (AMP-forming)/AMP-acid ligase II
VVVAISTTYRGDEVIVLPKFEIQTFLSAVAKFKINTLYIVPPIIIALTKNQKICSKYDLGSVHSLFTGAAPLGKETAEDLQKIYPSWKIRQGYGELLLFTASIIVVACKYDNTNVPLGLTETSTVVSSTSETDICLGTSGSLFPGVKVKLLTPEGTEITSHNEPGELVVNSPSVVLGYLNNDKANAETFIDDAEGRWMRTGDEAIITLSPNGNEHVTITERIKELIKVKGLQV